MGHHVFCELANLLGQPSVDRNEQHGNRHPTQEGQADLTHGGGGGEGRRGEGEGEQGAG